MKTSIKRFDNIQSVSDLPLFSWQVVVIQPSIHAGQFVTRRYRVHPAFADLIVTLAGLGMEARQ
jgi:hypothetical protein